MYTRSPLVVSPPWSPSWSIGILTMNHDTYEVICSNTTTIVKAKANKLTNFLSRDYNLDRAKVTHLPPPFWHLVKKVESCLLLNTYSKTPRRRTYFSKNQSATGS